MFLDATKCASALTNTKQYSFGEFSGIVFFICLRLYSVNMSFQKFVIKESRLFNNFLGQSNKLIAKM